MKGHLALALMALGSLKGSSLVGGPQPPKPAPSPKEAHDPIASLAREWLAKR